jgi:hypothetical protein
MDNDNKTGVDVGKRDSDQDTERDTFTMVKPKKKKRVCRSTYKGETCSNGVACPYEHPPLCKRCTTPENRVAGCTLGWHARHLHLPKASTSGNANGGKRPFPLAKNKGKGNGLSNGRSNDPRSNVINLERRLNLAALKQLRTELALEKAKRSTPVTTTVGTRTFAEVAAPVHAHFQPTQPKKVSDRYDVHVAFEEMGRRFMEQLAALAASIPRM